MMQVAPPAVTRSIVLRVGLVVLIATALFLPGWALYLAVILPQEHVTKDWDVVWVGFDLGLALLAATAVVALRRRSDWTPVLAGALAAALVCDAWFDVMTSRGDDRLLAISLAILAELPIAAIAAIVGVRSVRVVRVRSRRSV
jgi:hypothetical protein